MCLGGGGEGSFATTRCRISDLLFILLISGRGRVVFDKLFSRKPDSLFAHRLELFFVCNDRRIQLPNYSSTRIIST